MHWIATTTICYQWSSVVGHTHTRTERVLIGCVSWAFGKFRFFFFVFSYYGDFEGIKFKNEQHRRYNGTAAYIAIKRTSTNALTHAYAVRCDFLEFNFSFGLLLLASYQKRWITRAKSMDFFYQTQKARWILSKIICFDWSFPMHRPPTYTEHVYPLVKSVKNEYFMMQCIFHAHRVK